MGQFYIQSFNEFSHIFLGKILSLDRHPDHGEIGGLIYNLDSGERAVFVRDDFYLFGTCLAKMDLSYALSLIDKVKLVSEPIDDAKFLNECKEKFGGVEVYRRAKIVWYVNLLFISCMI